LLFLNYFLERCKGGSLAKSTCVTVAPDKVICQCQEYQKSAYNLFISTEQSRTTVLQTSLRTRYVVWTNKNNEQMVKNPRKKTFQKLYIA
jgi:hypothetical protein